MQIEKKTIIDMANSSGFKVEFDDIYKKSPVFQALVDTKWIDRYQNTFYKAYFEKAALPLPTDDKGRSLYSVEESMVRGVTNAMSRAKYSDMPSEGVIGSSVHTGTIGDFGKSHTLMGKDKQAYERLDKSLDGNLQLFKYYVDYVTGMLDSHYMQINHMAAQKMSYTRYSNADFLENSYNVPLTTPYEVDAEHRDIACGEKVWTDPTATIIDDLRAIVDQFREDTRYTGALTLKMPRDFFYNVFLKNNQVNTLIATYSQANGMIIPGGYMATKEAYEAWNSANGNYLPSIELMEQESILQGVSVRTQVSGWKDGVIVLSPAGYQGKLLWSTSDEYNTLESVAEISTAVYDGGLLKLMNRLQTNGRLPEWTTEVIGTYEPVLTEWNYHWCINSNKAKA